MDYVCGLFQAEFLRLFLDFPNAKGENYYLDILKYFLLDSVQGIEHLYALH